MVLHEQMLYDKTKQSESNLGVNDVVITKDNKIVLRYKWEPGRVEELLIMRDGII